MTKKTNEKAENFDLTADNGHNWVEVVVEPQQPCLQKLPQGPGNLLTMHDLYGELHNQGHDKFAEIGYSKTSNAWNNSVSPRDPLQIWPTHIESSHSQTQGLKYIPARQSGTVWLNAKHVSGIAVYR